jgi:hypothetical protein
MVVCQNIARVVPMDPDGPAGHAKHAGRTKRSALLFGVVSSSRPMNRRALESCRTGSRRPPTASYAVFTRWRRDENLRRPGPRTGGGWGTGSERAQKVFNSADLQRREVIFRDVCQEVETELQAFDGESRGSMRVAFY